MSDTHDHRGRGLEATGVAGIGATVSHNRIGRAAADAHTRTQTRRLTDIQARKAATRRTTVSPFPHPTWAKAGADQGLRAGAARRAALRGRSAQLRQLQGREDSTRRAIRGSGVIRARVASRALRGGLAVGPAALYLGARRHAEPVAKYTTRDVNAATGGAAVGVGTHQAVGWYGGHALEAKAKRKVDADPALQRRLNEHRAASGITGKTPTGDKKWLGFFRKYPHELPGAKTKRVLSYTHAGKTGVAANLAVATGAGAAAVGARRHHDKKAAVAKRDAFAVAKQAPLTVTPTSVAPSPRGGTIKPHHAAHVAEGLAIGGATVAAGTYAGARRFTAASGHVKRLRDAGTLVHTGPKVWGAAHPEVAKAAKMSRGDALKHMSANPDLLGHLHRDLGSETPSQAAVKLSYHMHPNGYTNPTIAHSRGRANVDLLHDPAGHLHMNHRVAATKAMIGHSVPAATPELHRGMRGVEHHVGDVIDFGHFSSFTSTRQIAHVYAGQRGLDHPGVYRIPKGTAKAAPVDGTGWASRNHEWLAGGKYKVVGKTSAEQEGRTVHHYELAPHGDVSKAMWSANGEPNRNARDWFADGIRVGRKRAKVGGATRAAYDRDIGTLAGGVKHGSAFKAGARVGTHLTPRNGLIAGGVLAGGATAAAVHHRKADGVNVAKAQRTEKDPGYGAASTVGALSGVSGAAAVYERRTANRIGQRGEDFAHQAKQHDYIGRHSKASPGQRLSHKLAAVNSEQMADRHARAAAEHARGAIGHGVTTGVLGVTGVAIAAHRHAHGKPKKRLITSTPIAKAGGSLVNEAGRGMWRLPNRRQAAATGFKGTLRGRNKLATMEHRLHGEEARDAFKGAQDRARARSGHSTSFNAGAKAGTAAHLAGKYKVVSIPAGITAASAPPLVVANHKHAKKEKAVAKSAFGVEISKADDKPGAKRGAKRGAEIGTAVGVGESAVHHGQWHSVRSAVGRAPSVGEHAGAFLTRSVPRTVAVEAGIGAGVGAVVGHRAAKREKKRLHAQQAQASVAKSAFGVVDERLEKGLLTSGLEALKGVKSGLSGAVGAERTGAAAAGKTAGAATRGKVVPIATGMTKTPARAAATAGGAGLGAGLLLSNKKNS